jgi:hypothetical protein
MRQGIAREVWRIDSVGPRNRPLISAGDKPIAELSIAWGNDAEANARLIAAAPELLAACKRLVTGCKEQSEAIVEQAGAMARAAISKAEGRD